MDATTEPTCATPGCRRRLQFRTDPKCPACTAAEDLGHDLATDTGRSDARHDPRMWDLLDLEAFPYTQEAAA